jgi:DNA-binding transcriptional ArsR family regulator
MIRASGEFDPREHPRYPKGFPRGGRFAPKASMDFVEPVKRAARKTELMRKRVKRLKRIFERQIRLYNPNTPASRLLAEKAPHGSLQYTLDVIDDNLRSFLIPDELRERLEALPDKQRLAVAHLYRDSLLKESEANEDGIEANELFIHWLESADPEIFSREGYDKLVRQAEERIRTYRSRASELYKAGLQLGQT